MPEVVLPTCGIVIIAVIFIADDPPKLGEERLDDWADETWEHLERTARLNGLKRHIYKCYLVSQPRNMRSFQLWLNPIDRGNGKKNRTSGSRNRLAMDFVWIEEQLNGNSLIHSIFFCVPASDFGSNHRSLNKKMCE